MTQTELLVAGIKARGYTEAKSPSGKYRMFANGDSYLFVGKNAALRKSDTPKIGDAVSISHSPTKKALIYVGECMQTWRQPVSSDAVDLAYVQGLRKLAQK